MLPYYAHCLIGYVNRETIHPQLCFTSFPSFPPGLLLHVRLPSLVQQASILYRVPQEERAKLREGVPYVKLYRYNPKHLYPKLNGYEDNGH